jgi:hypothetical protein
MADLRSDLSAEQNLNIDADNAAQLWWLRDGIYFSVAASDEDEWDRALALAAYIAGYKAGRA